MGRSIDPLGMLLVGSGLLGVVFGLLEGERYSWSTIWGPVGIPQLIGAGLVLLGIFVVWELAHSDGLLPIPQLRQRNYALGNLIAVFVAFSMSSLLLPLVLFVQVVLGLTALGSGYALTPAFLGLLVAAPIGGRLADRIGGKYPLVAGTIISGLGFGLTIRAASVATSSHDLIIPLVVIGIGSGLTTAPLFSMVMAGIPKEMVGAASAFVTASRQFGQVLGIAVIGGVLQNRLALSMHHQAIVYSAQLPGLVRDRFVTAMSAAVHGGARQLGAASAGSGNGPLPRLAHDVVTHAYVQAMGPTLAIGVAALALAAIGSLAMVNRRTQKAPGAKDGTRRSSDRDSWNEPLLKEA